MSSLPSPHFLIPSLLAFIACAAWIVVVGRMTNIGLSFDKRALTFIFAVAILCRGVLDYTATYKYADETRGWMAVATSIIIRVGFIVLAVVRYRELERMHPEQMERCRAAGCER